MKNKNNPKDVEKRPIIVERGIRGNRQQVALNFIKPHVKYNEGEPI